jgi:hypothetical protein
MNLEERFLNQAAAEKLPEGIVEVGPLTPDPEQFSKTATNRGDGIGFATGAPKSAVSGGSTAPTNLTPSSQVTSTGQKPLTPDEINKLINDPALRFSAVADRIRDTFNNEPKSELIPLDRTMRQELAYSMQQLLVDKFGVDNYRAGRLSESVFGGDRSGAPLGLGLIDVTPFVIPLAFQESGMSAKDSFKSIERGNLGQAALEYGTGMVQGAEAIPAVGMAVKGLKAGAKSLAPNIADVMESGLRKTGMITDIVPDGKSVIKPEDIKLIEETKSDWVFELPNGTRKNIDKFEYLSDIATMGQYAPSKEQMILSAKKDVAQMVYEQANKQAPKSDIGFYSAVENATINIQRKSGTGQSFLNDIMKGENVKPEEIKWIGLDDFLKNKKNVTKQEVQDYISNNKVDVREVKSTVIRPLLDNGARPVMEGDKGVFLPKFGTYQLAGGENYRELLLTMPSKNTGELDAAQKQADSLRKQTADLMADWKRISEEKPASDESKAAYVKVTDSRRLLNEAEKTVSVIKKESGLQTYSSEHFNQPNILAHLRVNDRVDADGKKMLLIEEVQSDWHQAGRDVGYAKNVQNEINAIQKQMDELGNQRDPVTNRMTNEKQWFELGKQKDELIKQSQGVPDAPFKDTWYQLALKRALQYASENGYERVGLTTGKQQIDRYSNAIRQNVDQISFYPFGTKGGTEVYAKKDNKVTFRGIIIDGKFIDGKAEGLTADKVLGKSMAKQIAEKKDGVITGDNLSIGGEGMKKYYDEAYPNFIDKYAKKWNAKIGETKINPKGTAWKYGLDLKDTDIPVRYVDITPEMKAGVKKGQPLFAAAPIGAATGAATMQDERKK